MTVSGFACAFKLWHAPEAATYVGDSDVTVAGQQSAASPGQPAVSQLSGWPRSRYTRPYTLVKRRLSFIARLSCFSQLLTPALTTQPLFAMSNIVKQQAACQRITKWLACDVRNT